MSCSMTVLFFAMIMTLLAYHIEVVQAVQCGGIAIDSRHERDLRSVLAGFWDAGKTTSGYRYCVDSMCAACYVNAGSAPMNRVICSDAASEVLANISVGSSGWCDYPGLTGSTLFYYWTEK